MIAVAPGITTGRLTVVSHAGLTADGSRRWRCSCSCGGSRVVSHAHLLRGTVRSCGCIVADHLRAHASEAGRKGQTVLAARRAAERALTPRERVAAKIARLSARLAPTRDRYGNPLAESAGVVDPRLAPHVGFAASPDSDNAGGAR